MTKDEALKLALEALELHGEQYPHMVKGYCLDAITAIKAALEAKDEPVNDELRRLHDLLGKANALARIRAAEIESMKASSYGLYELEKQRDELEQRLTKTEAQLGEAVWNYGELKREQLANQQNTSGSPIFSELHCICGAEWEWRNRDWELVTTPPPVAEPHKRKPLTDEEIMSNDVLRYHFALNGGAGPISKQGRRIIDAIEAVHGIKGEA